VRCAIPRPGAAVKAEPSRLPGSAVLAALIAQRPGDYPSGRIKGFGELVGAETVSPNVTWAYWWMRPPRRSRRRTRPAAPSPARGYIRGIRQVCRRSSGQDHFAASALADSCAGTGGDYGSYPPPMRIPDPALRSAGTFIKYDGDHLPHWSRPPGFHVCSMFARMSRYHAVAPVSGRHSASGDCRYLASVLA